MDLTKLFQVAARLGIEFKAVDGDQLLATPAVAITPAVREAIRSHKPAILARITRRDCRRHADVAAWLDQPDQGRHGWIRTTCRHCGQFVGNRPATRTESN